MIRPATLGLLLCSYLLCHSGSLYAQGDFSRADSLLGFLSELRRCYDVVHYDLHLRVLPGDKSIQGSNRITAQAKEDFRQIQIDLAEQLHIRRIVWQGQTLSFQREHQAVYVTFPSYIEAGSLFQLTVYYEGSPQLARNAPWDGGFVWHTYQQQPFIGVACQGAGAHIWYPSKDHWSDKPDSASLHYEVPAGLWAVGNGQLMGIDTLPDGFHRFHWHVSYPINPYNITLYVAPYVQWHDYYHSPQAGTLRLDYYVLPKHEETARQHFEQVKPMLYCFEQYFGTYPFWRDGYKLVEAPYLGMEHQSAIAYGNGYQNGYRGADLSNSGMGKRFDFIIIHESGHEYWGNWLSADDPADMWLHEAWCTYSEGIYVECLWGKAAADQYLAGYRRLIENRTPMLMPRGVHAHPPGDIYFKGALMLQTLRHVVNDDARWFAAIRHMLNSLGYSNTSSNQFIEQFNQQLGQDYSPFFRQYLESTQLPVLEYRLAGKRLYYRWRCDVEDFYMPFEFTLAGKKWRFIATTQWQHVRLAGIAKAAPGFDTMRFLIEVKEVE